MKLHASDLRASIVVALVALPLCLGIALASNAPLSAGILAGVVGGIVIGFLGGSEITVSGPAAGLIAIVAGSLAQLGGNYSHFATAIMLAGLIQLAMGILKAGEIGNYFPVSVIKGMLAAIGLILILKQLPHAVGWDADYMGDDSFGNLEGENTASGLFHAWQRLHWGATLVAFVAMSLMLFWDRFLTKKLPKLQVLPSALLAVVVGVAINEFVLKGMPNWEIEPSHLVQLPSGGVFENFALPDLSLLTNPAIWKIAITLALVATLQGLLSLDAADKLDPLKRLSLKNRELRAQGVGNFVLGLLGGLPLTVEIVRTSTNVASGALHKSANILHGVWLLLAVVLIPQYLNRIPLSVLAAVLILVGWRLTSPSVFKIQWKKGASQFIPFVVTIFAIVLTDMLVGIGIGMLFGLYYVLKSNSKSAILSLIHNDHVLVRFSKDVSFLQKSRLRKILRDLPDHSNVVIDGSRTIQIDNDILELVQDFVESANNRGINVTLQKSSLALSPMFKE